VAAEYAEQDPAVGFHETEAQDPDAYSEEVSMPEHGTGAGPVYSGENTTILSIKNGAC
jgi:hypothetical protein